MPSKIKYTIAIPAFKGVFFHECVASILSQSYTDFEVIIVDDCSQDPLKEIVDSFGDTRVRYYRNESNIGAENVVLNWNKCLEMANGEYFLLMGDDDRLESNALEVFNSLILEYPQVSVYHCRSKIIDEAGIPLMLTPSWPSFETIYDNIWHRITEKRAQYVSDFLYLTTVLKKNGGYFYLPLAWGSDDISSYIACRDFGIAHTNESIFNYRRNSYSISSTGSWKGKMEANCQYGIWLAHFLKVPPTLIDEIIVYNDLKRNLRKYIQIRKIYVMTRSMETNTFKNFFMWCSSRKQYGISYKEIGFSFLNSMKRKVAKTSY